MSTTLVSGLAHKARACLERFESGVIQERSRPVQRIYSGDCQRSHGWSTPSEGRAKAEQRFRRMRPFRS
jgi:hypothetical protein